MSNSSYRNKDFNTVHHITSRIAHKVRFLQDQERNDLVDIIRRSAEFTGVKLIGWCVMINHFHILAFLPPPQEIGEEEILRRYGVLKGVKAEKGAEARLAQLRLGGDMDEAARWLDSQKRRMYNIGEFVKIVKQWFTEEYNRRNGHKGTLWESAYYDRIVEFKKTPIEKCLGYVHLNPLRAAICATFDGYPWSSYSAFKKGDGLAVEGMRFVYEKGQEDAAEPTVGEISDRHEALLASLLEDWKRRRAEEIAIKRASGYAMPDDPLTDEAMLNQANTHLEEVRKASMDLRLQREGETSIRKQRGNLQDEIANILTTNPGMDTVAMEQALGVPRSSLYRYLDKMRKSGLVRQRAHGQWECLK